MVETVKLLSEESRLSVIGELRRNAIINGWVLNDLLHFFDRSRFLFVRNAKTGALAFLHHSGHPASVSVQTFIMRGDRKQCEDAFVSVLPEPPYTVRESPAELVGVIADRRPEASIYKEALLVVDAGSYQASASRSARRLSADDVVQLAHFVGADTAERLHRWVANAYVVGAFDANQLIALGSTLYTLPEVSGLVAVKTLPTYRGKGYATQVVAHLVEAALKRSEAVAVTVEVDNSAAERLYAKLGFTAVEERFWASVGHQARP